MDDQTPTAEGAAVPTPPAGMPPQDSALSADQPTQVEAKPAELTFIEETLGREFSSLDEAKTSLKNLNSLVGDQTLSKQRKALEKIASQANLSPDELLEVLETQNAPVPQEQVADAPQNFSDDTTNKRLVRMEANTFVKDTPEAEAIKDTLFAEALASGRPVEEIWNTKYAKIIEAGKKLGAKKLQSNLEGQPLRATSTASDANDTKVDFSGINPATGKRWTSKEMEQYIQYVPPSQGL